MRIILALTLAFLSVSFLPAHADDDDNTLNVYNWSDYLPDNLLRQFEKETGIHVNYSTYDSNETMYAKLKANPDVGYDIVVPSTYYIDRMRREHMLQTIDHTHLIGYKNLNPAFLNKNYDPGNQYSIPYLVTITGIIYNDQYYHGNTIRYWSDLWSPDYRNQLLALDDVRELFSIALIVLGDSPDTTDPTQIKAAFEKLQALLPNIKLFNAEAPKAIYIDEDANIGMAWSGDAYLAAQENPHIHFIYPDDGFIISQDSVAIPAHAPHIENAYKFINFILRPDIAEKISEHTGYTTPNLAALKFMPQEMRNSPIMHPSAKILARGHFQTDIGDAVNIYEKYYEQLKLSA